MTESRATSQLDKKPPLLRVERLGKTFAVPVLQDISLDFFGGSVHALMGPNGAGKSTLCNIISGVIPSTTGNLTLSGKRYQPASPRDAENAGIRMVRQELHLIENLSVAENICLTHLPQRAGVIANSSLVAQAQAALSAMGIRDIDPTERVSKLGIGHQQLVEITRALSMPSNVVILDEPTAALSQPQVSLLFQHLAKLKSRGCAIIYISHRMDEIEDVCDHVTILRDGRVVDSQPTRRLTRKRIVTLMAGDDVTAKPSRRKANTELPPVLELRGLSCGSQVRNVDLALRPGELLGIAGLIGSGRTRLLRALFGVEPVTAGEVRVNQVPVLIHSPVDAIAAGMSYAPEDRRKHGLLKGLSVTKNLTLGILQALTSSFGILRQDRERIAAQRLSKQMAIECYSLDQPVAQLSGGNQQKVVIGRCLSRQCRVALFDEPTRGVDIKAKQQIHELLREAAHAGTGVLVVSSDTDELMSLCDRIAVMSNGRLVAGFEQGQWTGEKLMAAALSGYHGPEAA